MRKFISAVFLILILTHTAGASAYQFFPTDGVVRVNALLREKPSTDSRKILTVEKDSRVTIYEVENNWMYVQYGKSKGYIRGDLFYDTTTNHSYAEPAQSNSGNKMSKWMPSVLMKFGTRGESVRQLQEGLAALNFNALTVDGMFDIHTENMVKAFQSSYGLDADGIVGERTIDALNEALEYFYQMNH